MSVNVKTFTLVTLMAIIGIVLLKVVFTKFEVKGFSDIIKSV